MAGALVSSLVALVAVVVASALVWVEIAITVVSAVVEPACVIVVWAPEISIAVEGRPFALLALVSVAVRGVSTRAFDFV